MKLRRSKIGKLLLPPGNWRWLYATLLVVVADQVSKMAIVDMLPPYQTLRLVPHLNLVTMHNTGAAFSMFRSAPAYVFVGLAVTVSIGILYWLWRNPRGQGLIAFGFTLIMGGAIGNAIDRLVRGYVVDFVDFYVGGWHFAAFNLADSAITIGAGFLLLDILLDGRRRKRASAG